MSLLKIVFLVLAIVSWGVRAQCASLGELPNGTCQVYPSTGLCAPYLQSQSVFVSFGTSTQLLDLIAATLMNSLESNRGIVNDDCRLAGDKFICNSVFMQCATHSPNNEAIPAPVCKTGCTEFWGKCQAAFDAFFKAAIQSLGQPAATFSFPHCGTGGTWTQAPQDADLFGIRSIPGLGPFPKGLHGQPRYPDSSVVFTRADTTLFAQACYTIPPSSVTQKLDINPLVNPGGTATCPALLQFVNGDCKIPCPFQVIPVEQEDKIGLASVIPAIIALIFCVFVFADSCFVIIESQGFNDVLRRQRRFLMFKGNSTTDTDEGTGTSGGKSGSRRRRNALRAATLYSLLGATLGIVYFMTGPLMTLIRKSKVSCGLADDSVDLLQLVLGQADRTDGYCAAQRISPFILQMVFNLILYAIVRVFMVVTEKSRRMTKVQNYIFDILLLLYCAGIPILFLVIAVTKDQLSTNLTDFITQFVRNSAICVMRLSVADEVILIFMPFIITGLAICALSYYIYTHLSIINQNVQGLASGGEKQARSSSATALRLLMIRLSFLGISTFIVLLVFISASASLMEAMANFAPAFNNLFLCQATKATSCIDCAPAEALMLSKLPSAVPFAAQLASMSAITLLFGGFFAAQSAARLYKEYQDGTLKLKVINLWRGKRANYDKDGMESSFQSFSAQEKIGKIPDVIQESCATLFCRRMKKFRDSMRDGRARGQVFRWVKGKPQKQPRKMTFTVANAWTSSVRTEEKKIQWQGVVGASDSVGWSSSNSNFLSSPRPSSPISSPHAESTRSPVFSNEVSKTPTWMQADKPSWGYSESKLSSPISSPFDAPSNSATRKEEFKEPPKLPEL